MRNSFGLVASTAVAVLAAVAVASPASAAIVVTNMGTVPGHDFSQATSVRDDGVAVGYAMTASGRRHGVLWQASGAITELATPGRNSEAIDINDAGVVVGAAERVDLRTVPVWWDSTGAVTELPGGYAGTARGVNGAGAVVGDIEIASGSIAQWAMRWENIGTGPTRLAPLPGGEDDAVAYDINTDGVVVGYSRGADRNRHAVVWSTAGDVSALDTPPGYVSCRAFALNDSGMIVGACTTAAGHHGAVRWDMTGGASVLPAFGTSYAEATAISEAGLIVGVALDTAGRTRPVRWGAFGTVTDLATLGGAEGAVYDINGNGTIVGRTMLPNSTIFRATSWHNAA